MSINMSGSPDAGDTELVTGQVVNNSSLAGGSSTVSRTLVDLDEIVDRRGEIAHLTAAYYRLSLAMTSQPSDAFAEVVGSVQISTSQGGAYVNNSFNPNDAEDRTDSVDPVGPPMSVILFDGESDDANSNAAGSSAVFDDLYMPDAKIVAEPEFDARDEIEAELKVQSIGNSEDNTLRLQYQFAFELRSA